MHRALLDLALGGVTRRAVLLDAMGTLVELDDPVGRLAHGLDVEPASAREALRAEMRFYRAHLHEGGTEAGLADLRLRCAGVVCDALGDGRRPGDVLGVLLDALRFTAFPDAVPALEAWRAEGATLVVLSNWDRSLHGVLEATGLRALVDGVVTSAETGLAKPDARIFAEALTRAGAPAGAALHVGDDPVADAEGAVAAGLQALLLVREGSAGVPGVATVGSLTEAVEHWRSA